MWSKGSVPLAVAAIAGLDETARNPKIAPRAIRIMDRDRLGSNRFDIESAPLAKWRKSLPS